MKIQLTLPGFLVLFLSFSGVLFAQQPKYYQQVSSVKVLNVNNDTIQHPWAGGMLSPMFSNIDLNGDGAQDLFVFEPSDNKISTFVMASNGQMVYAPAFESFFPELINWAFLVDYNKDNKPDIFAYSHEGGGIEVYKNETQGKTLKFKKVSGLLRYPPQDINIYTSPVDLPSITDIDGDGDIDILALDVFQGNVMLYRNFSKDKYGNFDSLTYDACDYCWGKFQEPTANNIPLLGKGCGPSPCKKAHGGFTLLTLDVDGDSDMDLLQGDLTSGTILLLKNGRIDNGQTKHPLDSMIAIDSLYPGASTRPNMPGFLAAFYVDVNNDGKRDLIVTPQDPRSNLNQVLLYRNNGADNNPSFEFVQDDFLQNNMIDLGQRAAPAFFDEDGDGKTDMVVATLGDYRKTGHRYERLVLYRNTGTAQKAVFKKENDDYLGLAQAKILGLAPAFGDLNKDGKTDLLLGKNDGKMMFYKNDAAPGQKANFVFVDSAFGSIDVGQQSTPVITDLNRDGQPDLVVGEQNGNIHYYKNDGSSFTLVTDSLGKIKTNRSFYEYEYDNNGKIIDSTLRYEREGFSAPAITDLNGDGKWDLITGALSGQIFFYNNIEDNINNRMVAEIIRYNPLLDAPENKNLGKLTMPAIANLNGDSIPELVIGNERGGMYLYANSKEVITVGLDEDHAIINENIFQVFPNPAKQQLNIALLNPGSVEKQNTFNATLYNILGQRVLYKNINNFSGTITMNINGLQPGIYILNIASPQGVMHKEKIIIE